MPDWLVWLIIAAVLSAAEAASLAFVLAMFAGGAGMAAIAAALGAAVEWQVAIAILGTIGLLWLVRPVAIRHLNSGPPQITCTDALVGREAVVLRDVTRDDGWVRLNGSEWSARTFDPKQHLQPGTQVTVVAIDGATAVVWHDPVAQGPTL